MSTARAVAVLGTASEVGKSTLAAALCRVLSDRGERVAPFKAQNMSNNSGATRDGLEMGRAQIVQALAARAEPHVDMNPVLLKPSSDRRSQVVLLGRVSHERHAESYYDRGIELREASFAALDRLRARYDVIVIEGAGSCAEVNLRSRDFINFEAAHHADAPVLLVADIDRGGVFAQVVGTFAVISPEDRRRIRGIVINKFRGSRSLFASGVEYLENQTGVPVVGLLPHLPDLDLDGEDAVQLDAFVDPAPIETQSREKATVAVIALPHISNFTDFDALRRHPACLVHYLRRPRSLRPYDAVMLPGTKAVRADLEWLRTTGWYDELSRYEAHGRIIGICGGYQMLGTTIRDPDGVEGNKGESAGFGWIDAETVLARDKIVARVSGRCLATGHAVNGYEIHVGRTSVRSGEAWFELVERSGRALHELDGVRRNDGRVFGTYVHGIFDARPWLDSLVMSWRPDLELRSAASTENSTELAIAGLAAEFREHVDEGRLIDILWPPR